MQEFQVADTKISGYLATPTQGSGSGVLVLHAWWGLTEPFRQVCDQLAQAGFVAFAPDLYHGQTASSIVEAEAVSQGLNQNEEQVGRDITGAVQLLHQHTSPNDGRLALIGFSLGGAYALGTSVNLADEIGAVVTFYASYSGPDYRRAQAAYLCHFAEDDPWEPAESVTEMQQALQSAGRPATFYTYPGTNHWFFEQNRPEYDVEAARLAWDRTITFLQQQLAV